MKENILILKEKGLKFIYCFYETNLYKEITIYIL